MGKRPLPPNAPDDPPARDPQPEKIDPVKEPPGDPEEDRPLRDPHSPDRIRRGRPQPDRHSE
jgi:hypothetical protein